MGKKTILIGMVFAMLLVAGCASQEATPAKSAGAIALEEKIAELNTCNEKITVMQKEVATLKSETAVFKDYRSAVREIVLSNKNTAPTISDLNKLNYSLSLPICQLYYDKYRIAYCTPLPIDLNSLQNYESYGKITNNADCTSKVATAQEYLQKIQSACELFVVKSKTRCPAYFDSNINVVEYQSKYWKPASEAYDSYSAIYNSYSDAVNEVKLSCFKN